MPSPMVLDCLVALIMAAGILCVDRTPDFPHRQAALGMGWIGVALPLTLVLLTALPIAPLDTEVDGTGAVVASLAVEGFVTTVMFLWLARGYGFILFFALASRLAPRFRTTFTQMATSYPGRYWWALPLFIAAKSTLVVSQATAALSP